MTTKRTRTPRNAKTQITDKAVELFRQMQQLKTECTCEPRDWSPANYWRHQLCTACEQWSQLSSQLHSELQLRPWDETIQNPAALCPYPFNTVAQRNWRLDPEAVARWHALEAACHHAD